MQFPHGRNPGIFRFNPQPGAGRRIRTPDLTIYLSMLSYLPPLLFVVDLLKDNLWQN